MVLPRAEGWARGHWRPWIAPVWDPTLRMVATAAIACPACGGWFSLVKNHTIASDGTVSPSVVCTHPGCTWHVFVRLDGWRS